jgi:hypothetical protein
MELWLSEQQCRWWLRHGLHMHRREGLSHGEQTEREFVESSPVRCGDKTIVGDFNGRRRKERLEW